MLWVRARAAKQRRGQWALITCVSPLWPPALVSSQRTQRMVTSRGRRLSHITSPDMHRTRVTSHRQQRWDNIISANQKPVFWWADQWKARKDWHLGDAELITVITLTMAWCHKGELWREKLPLEKVKVGTGFMSEVVCRVTRQMLAGNGTFITRRGQNIRRGAREKHRHWSLASVSSSPCSLWRQWAQARVLVSALIWIICPGMSTPDAGAQRKFWRKMSHKDV